MQVYVIHVPGYGTYVRWAPDAKAAKRMLRADLRLKRMPPGCRTEMKR